MEHAGERLRQAIDRQFGSIRKFQRKLKAEAPNLRGTSRQTLYRYFGNEAEPEPGFLQTAAQVLDVREAWLLGEGGEMTYEDEERAQRARDHLASAAKDHAGWDTLDQFGAWIEAEFPDPRLRELFTHVAILGAWMNLATAGLSPRWCLEGESRPEWDGKGLLAIRVPPDIKEEHREDYAMAVYLGKILAAPFSYLPISGSRDLSDAQLTGYVGTVCQGLQRLADTGINRRGLSVPGRDHDARPPSNGETLTTTEEEHHA